MTTARTSSAGRSVEQEYRYEHLTWPEINGAVAMSTVVLLPVGSTEQHGRYNCARACSGLRTCTLETTRSYTKYGKISSRS